MPRILPLAALLSILLLPARPAAAQDILAACTDGFAAAYPCNNVDLVARVPLSDLDIDTFAGTPGGNDIWGWTDPETSIEYALVGTTEGTAFVSLADPAAPVVIGTLASATSPSVWRDLKVRGPYVYIVSEARGHGMQVFDLRRLRDVTDPPVAFEADGRYLGAGSVHNIVIDETRPYAILVGARQNGYTCNGGGLHLVDIGRPSLPRFAGCFDNDGYTHDAQCVQYTGPDADYQGRSLCFSSNEDELSISDVSDVRRPRSISTATYPNVRYAHQGWLTEDQRYFVMDDELDESNGVVRTTRTLVFDVSDLDDPTYVGAHLSDVATIDHNQYIRGNYTYQSNYESGLRIYELTDLANAEMTLAGYFDTYPASDRISFEGQWSNYPYFESGLVIANDGTNGLFVLAPTTISQVASEDATPDGATGLSAAYPNPFHTRATLTLTLDTPEPVRAEVFDLLGRRVATLLDGLAGTAERLTLDGTGLPAGTYVVRVTGATFAETQHVTLVR